MDEHLFTDLDAILREAERLAAHTGAGAAEAQDPSPLHEQRAQQPPTPIIVYLVDPPSPEVDDDVERGYDPEHAVESLPQTQEEAAATPSTTGEHETEVPRSPAPPKLPRRTNQRGILVGVLCLFLAAAALTVFLLALFTASATVTIIPVSKEISSTTTLTVVTTGTANPHHHELAGRLLSALTLSQAQTVQTTGRGHEAAQAAHGWITFYNAAPFPQTIAAGTLLTGADGIEVVTGADAVIPAVTYPTLGEVQVPAQAVIAGPAGNIRAGEIYGPCCRLNVSAVSGAFTGGQEARSYPVVTARDLAEVVSGLRSDLAQSAQAAFQAEIGPNETLLAPRCTPQVTSDHGVGTKPPT